MLKSHCVYNEHWVRYQLVKSLASSTTCNWLFLPGGAGADSCYYLSLIEELEVPGQYWLLDLPANGSNLPPAVCFDYNFDLWESYFVSAIQRFENPILVGHSFGGMFPLLFPELENILQGLVILNSAPRLWLTEAENHAKANQIHMTTEAGARFRVKPSPETFREALLANAHCHFPGSSLERGKKMFEQLPFNYLAMLWWGKKAQEINFDAKWIPQKVPTLIMGGVRDFIIPCSLFEADRRFQRANIKIKSVPDAGHFLWLEQPTMVKKAFVDLHESLK